MKNIKLLCLILVLLLSSCEEGSIGIFMSVAEENDTTGNATKAIRYSSPSYVVKLNTTYYAGIGELWQKASSDKNWSIKAITIKDENSKEPTNKTSDKNGIVSTYATLFNSNLYANFSDASTSAANFGLQKSSDGTNWSMITGFPSDGESIVGLYSVDNTKLFAVTASSYNSTDNSEKYSVYVSTDGSTFTNAGISAVSGIGVPSSIIKDSNGVYWLTAGSHVYIMTASTFNEVTTAPNSSDTLSGICAVENGVIASSRTGYLYYSSDNGNTWTASDQYKNSSSKIYSFSAPIYLDQDSTNKVLLVPTNSIARSTSDYPPEIGYLEFKVGSTFTDLNSITLDASHSTTSSAANYDVSLDGQSISSFSLITEASGYKLFANTNLSGLWSNTYTSDGFSGWNLE